MKLKLSKAEGQRKKEAVGINSSLSVLGKAPPRARVLGRTDASKSPQRPRQKRQPPPLGWDALALWFYANMKQIAFEVSTEDFAWYHLPRFGALPAARLRALSYYWYNTADH